MRVAVYFTNRIANTGPLNVHEFPLIQHLEKTVGNGYTEGRCWFDYWATWDTHVFLNSAMFETLTLVFLQIAE